MGADHGLGWLGPWYPLVLPGASDQDGQGLHCAGVLGGCHRDRLDAGHLDSGLGGAGTLGGGRGPPAAVRSGLACRPEPGGWTLFLAAAVKLNPGQSRVAIAVGWEACWWSWHGVAPRVPPNIADSREIRIQGPFLTPARFPHRRNRDSRGCFHTPRPNWPARNHLPPARQGPTMLPVGRLLARSAGWSVRPVAAARVGWAKLAVPFNAAWPGMGMSADGANTSADLAEIINHLLAPDTGGRFSTGVLGRTRRRGGTYEGPERHLGSAAGIAAGRWRIGPASHGAAADRPGQQSGDRRHLLVGQASAPVTCGGCCR